MKKIGIICLIFCLLLSICQFSVYAEPETTTENLQAEDAYGIDASVPLLGHKQLVENVKSAFLYELTSDTLMYTQNPDERMYPSSFVKVLTALIAIEKGTLNDTVVATEEVLNTVPYNAVSAELKPDEKMKLQDLIYCMMVGSANDAAAVIANHISGSQDAFVQELNTYARELGCNNTQFMNVHGLHHEEQYTTARDMARILRQAMKNETFVSVYSTVRYTVPKTNKSDSRDLATGNFLMNDESLAIYFDERVTGGRTGVAEDGTRCLATCAEKNGLKLICIVMGAEDVTEEDGNAVTIYGGYKETSTLFDKGMDGYKAVQVLFPNQAVTQISVLDGVNDVVLGSDVAVSAVLPSKVQMDDLTFHYANNEQLRAPISKGDKLSQVEVWYGATCVARGDLLAMNAVPSVNDAVITDDTAKDETEAKDILTIILCVVVVCVLVVIAVRFLPSIRNFLTKRRMKRYRRNRRRSR